MNSVHGVLSGFEGGQAWSIACGLAVAVALFWAWRMHRLHADARDKYRNGADLIENLSEGIYRSSLDGRQLSANKALVRLNGYDSEAEMLSAVTDIAVEWYVEPGRRDQFRDLLQRDGQVEDFVSEIYRHKTRERIWISESARIVRDKSSGKALYYEGSVREITETVRRLRVEERFRKVSRAVPGALFQCCFGDDGSFTVPYVSGGFERLTGLSHDAVRNSPEAFTAKVSPADRKAFVKSMFYAVANLEPWDHEFRFIGADGCERWFRGSATIERTRNGTMLHGYVNDISVRKRQAIEIEKLAYFDALTGLPNRRLLVERLTKAMEQCRQSTRYGALLFIDLDSFKTLNDTQGHDVGDEYLMQVARRLTGAVGPDDTVSRIGGDEFVVILHDLGFDAKSGRCRATDVARTILKEMGASYHLGVVQHQSSASIGFVAFDGSPLRVEELLKRADIAMYEAKAGGRNRIAVFDPDILEREKERYKLINDLRFAISEHRFELMMQPRVGRDGRIVGAQANAIWRHPELGVIAPEKFVPLAAQLGLGEELGKVMVSIGVAALRRWQADPALSVLRLALNIGVAPVESPDFLIFMQKLVARSGIDASRLTLEIGDAIPDTAAAAVGNHMLAMKLLGIRFALDQFGSGKPPLALLKTLPFDEVRIVGPFVADVTKSHYDRTIAHSMFVLAGRLGLTTVAGDIPSPEHDTILREFGCEVFEGPLYGAALPERLLAELVVARSPTSSTPPLADRKRA